MQRAFYSIVFSLTLPILIHAQTFEDMSAATGFDDRGFNRGIAIGDFDNDGLEDIYVSTLDGPNLLYRNLGNFEFEEVGAEYGLDIDRKTNCSLWFDLDNDGDLDIFLANSFQGNMLLRNDGNTFRNISGQFGVGTNGNTKTLHAVDYDNDGDLDIYVTVFFDQNILWRNDNGTNFTNVTTAAGIDDTGRSLGAIFVDYDLDGDQDLYQTRDGDDTNQFYINNGDGTFTEASAALGLDFPVLGMGTDVADLNGDRFPDIYLTNLRENHLYINRPGETFEEIGEAAGVHDIGMGWSTFFFDCNNDGRQDIYVANDSYFGVDGIDQLKNRLYVNMGDLMFASEENTDHVQNEFGTYGAAFADFDLDGKLDIAVSNNGQNDGNQLFQNTGQTGNYVALRLRGTRSNTMGIGARIELYSEGNRQVDYVNAGSGYVSQNTQNIHFGLGSASPDSAIIFWPSGTVQTVRNLQVNAIAEVVEEIPIQDGEVVWTEPAFPTQEDNITVYFNAKEGNGELAGFNGDVYAHTGVVTNLSPTDISWRHVIGNWATDDSRVLMDRIDEDLYTLSYNINVFYDVPDGELVERLAFVFRNVDGTLVGRDTDGSDIFTPVVPPDAGLLLFVDSPQDGSNINSVITIEDSLLIEAETNVESQLTVLDNGEEIFTSANGQVRFFYKPEETGRRTFEFVATTVDDTTAVTREAFVASEAVFADPPMALRDGVNYTDSSFIFQLTAPAKSYGYLMCPANQWSLEDEFRMLHNNDGIHLWIEVLRDRFEEGQTIYQYAVNGALIGDPHSEIVLDRDDDPFIPFEMREDLPSYPAGANAPVTFFDFTDEESYEWQNDESFTPPKKTDLVIYELLVRDFLEDHWYESLIDTLDYLERLGINAIQLMPVSEFEGNISWGYNPSFHGAADKYYGTRESLKRLVDEAHGRGMAVILDVVYNHTFSEGPLARLYWDEGSFRPTPESPYLNVTPRHPFNVGYDFNHEANVTREWVKQTLEHWITEYHMDGFRFDLSKGFTQRNSGDDVGFWGRYDASRVAILKEYADFVWDIDPDNYFILEHFADNDEETELANYGMMLWGNMTHEFGEAAMGFRSELEWTDYQVRGWNDPHLVSYMESHDEERMMYRLLNFGDSDGDYNTRELPTATRRVAAAAAVFYSIPGPKMLWQFGEVGYDFPINYCPNGTINDGCRTDPKPIRWDYYDDEDRRRLFDKMAAMIHLKIEYPTFETRDYTFDDRNLFIKYVTLRHEEMDAHTFANFRVTTSNINPRFPYEGTWYEYFTGDSIIVTDLNARIDLGPGEYRVYTSERITPPDGFFTNTINPSQVNEVDVRPNPVSPGGYVDININESEAAEDVLLHTIDGRLVSTTWNPQGNGIRIEIPADLVGGMYFIRVATDENVYSARVVVAGK